MKPTIIWEGQIRSTLDPMTRSPKVGSTHRLVILNKDPDAKRLYFVVERKSADTMGQDCWIKESEEMCDFQRVLKAAILDLAKLDGVVAE